MCQTLCMCVSGGVMLHFNVCVGVGGGVLLKVVCYVFAKISQVKLI